MIKNNITGEQIISISAKESGKIFVIVARVPLNKEDICLLKKFANAELLMAMM
jgi:hypothetical protein